MFESPNFWLALPEIFVMSMACVVLLIDLYLNDRQRIVTYLLTLATLAGAFALSIVVQPATATVTFSGSFVIDDMALVLKLFIYVVSAAVFMYSRPYLEQRSLFRGEYFVLGLFGVLGMMVLVSAHSFLTIYLGLELMSLAMYAMVAMQRDSVNASEAAMKYFVLSALASGMLLYGMSLLYGVSGTLDIGEFAQAIAAMEGQRTVVISLGLVLAIIGVVFKLGAVPFHMWIPDVYHGAPTSVTLYITAAPNLAAFAMLMRLLVEGLGDLQVIWQDFFIIMAVLSMGVGNVIAIAQSNLKRMLAYSTISHVGFLFLGFLSGTAEGYAAAMFYALVYAIMSAGGFGMILLLSRAGFEADQLDDFKGLNERSPWFAAMMLILMFSMAGVPPTLGFYAKLSVLQAVIGVDLVWLAVVAIIFSIIGAFYYLRIIKLMYFDKPQDTQPLAGPAEMRIALSVNGLAVLGLGLFPGSLLGLCATVMGQAG